MRRLLLTFFIIFGYFAWGQTINFNGYIYDKTNNECLINTYVYEVSGKYVGLSNEYGYFSLKLPKGNDEVRIVFKNVAYQSDTIIFIPSQDTMYSAFLSPGQQLKEVVIKGGFVESNVSKRESSMLSLSSKQINLLPAFGGERDIIKAYQLMPGVQSGNEGSSGLIVRGGSKDQNLIIIDGAPVYYVNHMGGLVSVFNNDVINDSKLYKGGFPAKYSGRLSSVLDINMREGNKQKYTGSFTLGMLSSKVLIEGPIEKEKSSFIISYRRMVYDVFMRMATNWSSGGKSSQGYFFQDLNVKINRTFSPKNKLFFSVYFGDDRFGTKSNGEIGSGEGVKQNHNITWGNLLMTLRWVHLYDKNLFSTLIAYSSRYQYQLSEEYEKKNADLSFNTLQEFYTGIQDYNLKKTFYWYPVEGYEAQFGISGTYHSFKPGITKQEMFVNSELIVDSTMSDERLYSWETNAFLENKIEYENFSMNLGMSITAYLSNTNPKVFYEPRVSLKYKFLDIHSVSFSYAKMHQNVHLLSGIGNGMPIDVWLPATQTAPPSTSDQYVVGYSSTILQGLEFSVEAYYKQLENLITFKVGETYLGVDKTWGKKIETGGKGEVYGVDFLLQKTIGKYTGWIGYTWMKNTRQFENINNGNPYPYRYDRTHDISFVSSIKISENIDLSLSWVYGTGKALTLPISKYYLFYPDDPTNIYGDEIKVYTEKNAFREQAYHRLDFGVNFRKKKKWGERIWNISIYNVYNRINPYRYEFESTSNYDGSEQRMRLIQHSLFPFIPSFSFTLKFF